MGKLDHPDTGPDTESTVGYLLKTSVILYENILLSLVIKFLKPCNDVIDAKLKLNLWYLHCRGWTEHASSENRQRVMTVMRMLMRDPAFHRLFVVKLQALGILCYELSRNTAQYLSGGDDPATTRILIEMTSKFRSKLPGTCTVVWSQVLLRNLGPQEIFSVKKNFYMDCFA